MPDIRYVCLSDLHLGEEDSLLTYLNKGTADPTKPDLLLKKLVECLRELISKNEGDTKPTLIMNGDILDMAFARTHEALMAFAGFMKLVMPLDKKKRLFDRIIFIPGNHDHHIWELARETQYVNQKIKTAGEKRKLPEPEHTTPLFVKQDAKHEVQSFLLTNLINERLPYLKDLKIIVAYPNFGIYKKKGDKCVVFHHGHFVESKYYLMSYFDKLMRNDSKWPKTVNELQADNFAWIDFFWSTMGRSGRVARTIETLYEKMENRDELMDAIDTFAENLKKERDLGSIKSIILKGLLRYIAGKVTGERDETEVELSADAEELLKKYMKVFLYNQLKAERDEKIPGDLTFVFGHTHKPFRRYYKGKDFKDKGFNAYPKGIKVYNTGGWIVESTDERKEKRGGAILLLDENLNTVSVEMYKERDQKNEYVVEVKEARPAGQKKSAFHEKIAGLVGDGTKDPWSRFSRIAWNAVILRASYLKKRQEQEL